VLEWAEDHAQSQLLMLTALNSGFLHHRVQSLITSQFIHPILFKNDVEYSGAFIDLKKEYNSVRRRSFLVLSMGLLYT
jgi:hypothetical protein